MSFKRVFGVLLCIVITLGTTATAALSPEAEENLDKYLCTSGFSWWCLSLIFGVPATHASPATFSNLRWRYLVESEDLKSTSRVSSDVLSSARVAGMPSSAVGAAAVGTPGPIVCIFTRHFFGGMVSSAGSEVAAGADPRAFGDPRALFAGMTSASASNSPRAFGDPRDFFAGMTSSASN